MTMLLKYPLRLTAFLLAVVLICANCAPAVCAAGPEPEVVTVEVIEEVVEETEPVIDEIPDDVYQSYVLGCRFVFVAIIVFYFGYKFFAMFF